MLGGRAGPQVNAVSWARRPASGRWTCFGGAGAAAVTGACRFGRVGVDEVLRQDRPRAQQLVGAAVQGVDDGGLSGRPVSTLGASPRSSRGLIEVSRAGVSTSSRSKDWWRVPVVVRGAVVPANLAGSASRASGAASVGLVWIAGDRRRPVAGGRPPWPLSRSNAAPAVVVGAVHHPVEDREAPSPQWLAISETGHLHGHAPRLAGARIRENPSPASWRSRATSASRCAASWPTSGAPKIALSWASAGAGGGTGWATATSTPTRSPTPSRA